MNFSMTQLNRQTGAIDMVKFGKLAAYVLGLFMVAMGAMKFFGGVPIFQLMEDNLTLKYRLELSFVEPALKYIIGVLELIAGTLLMFRKRLQGAVMSLVIIGGAILTHIVVIGIKTPISAEPNADKSPMLFIIAVIFFSISLWVYWSSRPTGKYS